MEVLLHVGNCWCFVWYFGFWGVRSKPGCQRHHALEFWMMILDSGNTCNYWRIKMTLMGFCMRFCKTSTDLVFVFRIHWGALSEAWSASSEAWSFARFFLWMHHITFRLRLVSWWIFITWEQSVWIYCLRHVWFGKIVACIHTRQICYRLLPQDTLFLIPFTSVYPTLRTP